MWAQEKAGGAEYPSDAVWKAYFSEVDAELVPGPKAMWPTPNASALNEHETPESFLARAEKLKSKGYNGNGASMPLGVAAKLWPTPRTGCHGEPGEDSRHPTIAGLWATPSARDWKSDDAAQSPEHSPPPGRQVLRTETDGSDGSTPAVLNPSFVEALMGFPPSWTVPTVSARSETPSSPHRPLERSSGSHGGR